MLTDLLVPVCSAGDSWTFGSHTWDAAPKDFYLPVRVLVARVEGRLAAWRGARSLGLRWSGCKNIGPSNMDPNAPEHDQMFRAAMKAAKGDARGFIHKDKRFVTYCSLNPASTLDLTQYAVQIVAVSFECGGFKHDVTGDLAVMKKIKIGRERDENIK